MTQAPLSWIKTIHTTLMDAKTIPLFGSPPHFPWESLSEKVASLLQAPVCKIYPRDTTVLQPDQVLSGFGSSPVCIALDLTPLSSQAFFVMGKEDVAHLTTLALTSSPVNKGFSSPNFQEGFYYFLATQLVEVLDELRAFGDLGVKIAKFHSLPQEESLCIDIEIEHPKQRFWGRLICPTSLHQEFRNHFSQTKAVPLDTALAKEMHVSVRLELGKTTLPLHQWKNIAVGDFVVLDRCTFDPHTHKGTATLMLEQTPLLRARIKETHLKIVDYALYREENTPMDPKTPEEDLTPEIPAEEISHHEIEEENEEGHLWAPENTDLEKLISPNEIPLTLCIEVARLQISLEKLLQLSPGNVLELPTRPEQGVDVVIEGKKVAKAELIKLGDVLGIKILKLGE